MEKGNGMVKEQENKDKVKKKKVKVERAEEPARSMTNESGSKALTARVIMSLVTRPRVCTCATTRKGRVTSFRAEKG